MSSASLLNRVKHWIAELAPEDDTSPTTDPHARLRQQVLVGFSIICGLIAGFFAVEMFYLNGFGEVVAYVMLTGSLCAFFYPFLLRLTGRVTVAGSLFTLQLVATIALTAALGGGGIESAALAALPLAVLIATFVSGPNLGAATTAVSLSLIWGFYGLYRAGVAFPRTWSTEEGYLLEVGALSAIVIMIGFLGWLYERRSIHALQQINAQLKHARDKLEERVEERTAELAKANAELAVKEERFRELVLNASDIITILDSDRRVIYNSPSVRTVLGHEPDEEEDHSTADRVHPEDRSQVRALFRQIKKHPNQLFSNCIRYRHAEGHWVHLEVKARNLLDNPRVGGIVLNARDITAHRRYEEELLEAKREAEAATQAKSQFLARMSHEIRTPMNGVIGMTDLLLDTSLNEEQREMTRTIQTSGNVLLTLIEDILDFSKIESGHLELEQQPFELHTCLSEALDVVADRAVEQELDLALDLAPDVPETVVGDITRLRQVLINLLSNAIKFTEAGSVLVRVRRLEATEKDAPTLSFAVQDTGIGIEPDRLDYLFESFSQADSSTTRKYGGTGLGLAICKQLVELMGGEISAESRPGEGSTFRFTIAVPTSEAPPAFMQPNQPAFSERTALLISGAEATRRSLARQLRHWGFAVDHAKPDEPLRLPEKAYAVALVDHHGLSQSVLAQIAQRVDNQSGAMIGIGGRLQGAEATLTPHHLVRPACPQRLHEVLLEVLPADEAVKADTTEKPTETTSCKEERNASLRILIAEDNHVNQKVIERILQHLAYAPDVVTNGREALEAVQENDYDVVLMDVQMPEMDGFEATQRIRAAWPEERPRIIAMTANAMAGDRERCLEAGMDDYMAKPIQIEELCRILKACTQGVSCL